VLIIIPNAKIFLDYNSFKNKKPGYKYPGLRDIVIQFMD